MSKKACLFIDGENLRHSILSLFSCDFDKSRYLPEQSDWAGFYDWLVANVRSDCERVRAYWYVVEMLDFRPFMPLPTDQDKQKMILSRHTPFKERISKALVEHDAIKSCRDSLWKEVDKMKRRFERWRRIQDQIVQDGEAIEFRRAGSIRYDLYTRQLGSEKAVDVKLATDMIVLRDTYDIALVVSGDQDYVPAVQAVKDSGRRVVNVAFRTKGGRLLPGGARRLNEHTDQVLEVPYDEFKKRLRL